MTDTKKPEEIGTEDLDMAVGGKSEATLSTAKDEQRIKMTGRGEEDNGEITSKIA